MVNPTITPTSKDEMRQYDYIGAVNYFIRDGGSGPANAEIAHAGTFEHYKTIKDQNGQPLGNDPLVQDSLQKVALSASQGRVDGLVELVNKRWFEEVYLQDKKANVKVGTFFEIAADVGLNLSDATKAAIDIYKDELYKDVFDKAKGGDDKYKRVLSAIEQIEKYRFGYAVPPKFMKEPSEKSIDHVMESLAPVTNP